MTAPNSAPIRLSLDQGLAAEMAESCPEQLLELILSGTLEPFELFSAAEAAGRIQSPEALGILEQLLRHEHHLVREGAVLGLAEGLPATRELICKTLELDSHPSVKKAARNVLTR